MKFKLDENLPYSSASIIMSRGLDVETVLSEELNGCPDDELIDICDREQRTLITLDLDFADMIAYPPDQHYGIVVIRGKDHTKDSINSLIIKILPKLEDHSPVGKLWIVEQDRIRIR